LSLPLIPPQGKTFTIPKTSARSHLRLQKAHR
jgi:hypothetical protein